MQTITLQLNLDAETISSLDSRKGDGSIGEFLKAILNTACSEFVANDFNAAAQRRIEDAKGLPLPDRLAILESIDQAISNAAT